MNVKVRSIFWSLFPLVVAFSREYDFQVFRSDKFWVLSICSALNSKLGSPRASGTGPVANCSVVAVGNISNCLFRVCCGLMVGLRYCLFLSSASSFAGFTTFFFPLTKKLHARLLSGVQNLSLVLAENVTKYQPLNADETFVYMKNQSSCCSSAFCNL